MFPKKDREFGRGGRVDVDRELERQRAAIVRRLFKHSATGTYTKQEILQKATQWGLTNRRGQPLSSQAIGMLLRNRLYIGVIDVPDFGVRDQRGDFEPLILCDRNAQC
jgi:Recombinase